MMLFSRFRGFVVGAFLANSLVAGVSQAGERLPDHGPNAVSLWSKRGAATIVQKPEAKGTEQERRPVFFLDMATLHLAIYEAVAGAPDLSREAAVHEAAYTVLRSMFPQRAVHYEKAYEEAMDALADGPDKQQGRQIGAEQAKRVLGNRANDGRWAKFVPVKQGTTPGAYRGAKAINQFLSQVKPFALNAVTQFRSPPPPALDSEDWKSEVAETRARGGAQSPASERQIEDARFHTEPPPRYWTNNLVQFARSQTGLAENARLMALIWVTQADVVSACFEAKYHYYRWRPATVIGASDKTWQPRLRTPPHPEYPAAHSCSTAAFAESIASFFGTRELNFSFSSKATGSTHQWKSVDEMIAEVREARIIGGMHFRAATVAGEKLGVDVARWMAERY